MRKNSVWFDTTGVGYLCQQTLRGSNPNRLLRGLWSLVSPSIPFDGFAKLGRTGQAGARLKMVGSTKDKALAGMRLSCELNGIPLKSFAGFGNWPFYTRVSVPSQGRS
eukprot:6104239-Amphidinium_carterae.1